MNEMSQVVPECPKMPTSDASLSEWTCFLTIFAKSTCFLVVDGTINVTMWHRCMERFVLGTSQPSFKPESKARPNLLVLFPTVCIGIPLKITIFLPLDHQKMTFAMLFCQKSSFLFRCRLIFVLPLRPMSFKTEYRGYHSPLQKFMSNCDVVNVMREEFAFHHLLLVQTHLEENVTARKQEHSHMNLSNHTNREMIRFTLRTKPPSPRPPLADSHLIQNPHSSIRPSTTTTTPTPPRRSSKKTFKILLISFDAKPT